MKYKGTFTVRLITVSEDVDSMCSLPLLGEKSQISFRHEDFPKPVYVHKDEDDKLYYALSSHDGDFMLESSPEAGDEFKGFLPQSSLTGTVKSVRKEFIKGFETEYWILEVDGEIEGAYNSFTQGNRLFGVVNIPLDGEIESTEGEMTFRDYLVWRLTREARKEKLSLSEYLSEYGRFCTQQERDFLETEAYSSEELPFTGNSLESAFEKVGIS